MPSLKLSNTALPIVKQARKEKGWTIDNPLWLETASQIIEPNRNWENSEVFAIGVSLPTWKRFLQGNRIDANVFKVFCQMLGLNWEDVVEREFSSPTLDNTQIPNIPLFFGRSNELKDLTQKIDQGTRLIAITGMGGIGKTAVAAKLAEALRHKFPNIFWFSMHLTPPPINPTDLLPSLTPHSLIIFDSWDTILGGEKAGKYLPNYQLYAGFLRFILHNKNSSYIILTSREQPEELNTLTIGGAVIFPLGGLVEGAIELLRYYNLTFTANQRATLINQYGGNPLFLNIAANVINELFAGNVQEFIAAGTIVTGEFEPLVMQWFRYISPLERILLKSLATYPQGLTREEIQQHLTNDASTRDASTGSFLAALLSLKRRALIDTYKIDDKEIFVLQPVILKCVRRLL